MSYEELSKIIDFRALPEPGDRFGLEKVIATGTYGEIYEAVDKENDNKRVAIKVIDNIKENLEEVEEEYRVLAELSLHENFPVFYGAFVKRAGSLESHQMWLVMELLTHGTVSDLAAAYKNKEERMPEEVIAYILREVIKAVQHLHAGHVIHRDIKGMNILITEEGKVKLVDFGQCGHLDNTMGKRCTAVGTPFWMAPEVIECEQKADVDYDNRCDVWSLGITAIELGDGDPPYADLHPVRALFQIIRNPPPQLRRVSDWTQDFVDFISECLVKNPDHRPVMLEVLEHPFIQGVPEDDTAIKAKLLAEHSRLFGREMPPSRPRTAIARQGYLKTDRRSKPKKMVTDNLASLEFFNDEIVVETLHARWQEGHIYTWLADVLLAVNPFSEKCKYDEETKIKYKSKTRSDNDPHVFAVADRAHQDMMHNKEHQTIIFSGESGSGKTFNFAQVVYQLCHIGSSNPGLIDKVKKTLVVLDAFGNAVTQLNPDATRHTRYFDITFSRTGKVSGVIVWLLMLDKFRVTHRVRGESNFHIFYYLYDGLSQSSRLARYGLKLGRKYHYLAKHPFDNEVTNAQRFNKAEEALQIIGFTDREIHTIYLILAAILNIGNIDFQGDTQATIADMEPVKEVCRLLDADEKKLAWALCNCCVVKPGGQVDQRKKTAEEAMSGADALARTLYCRVVDFLVNMINTKMSVTRLVFGDPYAVGVLDMFGFEANDHNTLENLLVNVANEQVQYYYNQYIFNWEMQDYSEEGIPTKNFSFPDNRHILELFLGKSTGIFAILEDESRETNGNDMSFANTIEAEAARYVQYYFRKWKTRTLFQQLQLYRAEKQQQLVYFSQQVHLYSQELQAKMQRLNYGMDLSKVRNEAPGSHKTILAKPIKPPPKLALDHTLNAYFDTTFLCDPSRAKKGRQQDDDWEAPFKSRAAAARASNMGLEEKPDAGPSKGAQFTPTAQPAQSYTPMDVRSRTAMFNQGVNSNQPTGGAASYNRFAGTSNTANKPTNYNKYLGVSNKPPASQSYNKYGGSYLNKGAAPKPPVVVNTWNDRQHNGYNDNVDEDSQGTHDFRKHLRKTNRSAILEMEQKAASGGDGAFNFQGMLRKTGNKRESLKRDEGGSGGASYHPNGGGTMSPTFVEETEEAML
ncbi:neither inactivation nor afterpotential protein C [Penaeus vannamei]|uniref:neither inactivation nor afterpotential protein C n=1 Tax=Penaeus vannamei TaxID=6689 RepID=UPI00387F93EF